MRRGAERGARRAAEGRESVFEGLYPLGEIPREIERARSRSRSPSISASLSVLPRRTPRTRPGMIHRIGTSRSTRPPRPSSSAVFHARRTRAGARTASIRDLEPTTISHGVRVRSPRARGAPPAPATIAGRGANMHSATTSRDELAHGEQLRLCVCVCVGIYTCVQRNEGAESGSTNKQIVSRGLQVRSREKRSRITTAAESVKGDGPMKRLKIKNMTFRDFVST